MNEIKTEAPPPIVYRQRRSDELNQLFAALSIVQGKLKPVALDTTNPFFKSEYASYQACRVEAQPHLAEAGLAVFHVPCILPDGRPALECFLTHKSGQWMSGIYPLNPVKNDPQSLGSATTYAKRYSFKAMVGLFDKEDDDGNAATQGPKTESPKPPPPPPGKAAPARRDDEPPPHGEAVSRRPAPPPGGHGGPTEKQLSRLWAIARAGGWERPQVHQYIETMFNVKSTSELSKAQYDNVCGYMENNPPGEWDGVPF